jgi:hypothetical protein
MPSFNEGSIIQNLPEEIVEFTDDGESEIRIIRITPDCTETIIVAKGQQGEPFATCITQHHNVSYECEMRDYDPEQAMLYAMQILERQNEKTIRHPHDESPAYAA